jgi:CRISPR-associated helicase Cas3
MTNINLKIGPRFVKQDKERLRPFQFETLQAIRDLSVKIIKVEAPVGAGKSHIIRELIESPICEQKPVILTYPTKILMDAQIQAIKKDFAEKLPLAVWPDDREKFPMENGINIFKYSSDSLLAYFSENIEAFELFKTKGELMKSGLFSLEYGKQKLFVTTADVLWLIYSMKYKGASFLQAQLNSAIVFFDEFHTYANLYNFYSLLDNLIFKSKVDKVILLSATPFIKKDHWSEIEDEMTKAQMLIVSVDFKDSLGTSDDKIFNYPLELNLLNFKYTDIGLSLKHLSEILEKIHAPAAIIFDSIFRLKHLRPEIEQKFMGKFMFREWSGMHKDEDVPLLVKNQENVVILGTSAIEVGIDMKLRSMITEASDWASAIQRIGRVGRMSYLSDKDISKNVGFVYLFVNSRDTSNRFGKETQLSRDSFESILQDALPDPGREMIGGELFRGESYNFILVDKYIGKPVVYSEAIFSMYELIESQCRNFWGADEEKAEILRDVGIQDKNLINEVILRDKLFPIWGVIVSEGLRDTYVRILEVRKEKKPEGITVYTESNPAGFHFYREKAMSTYLEQSPW